MADTLPCDVCNVKQTINTTEVDERTIIGDVLDDTLEYLTFLKVGYKLRPCLRPGLFQNGAARYNNIAATAVDFQNLEGLRCSYCGPRSRTGRISTLLPGRNAVAPDRSTVKPP